MMLRMLLFLLLVYGLGHGSASIPATEQATVKSVEEGAAIGALTQLGQVSCLISNLEHTDCTWSHLELNYTFQSRLGPHGSFQDCPWYLQEGGYNVGCRLPFKTLDKFSSLYTRLSNDNNVTEEQTIVMKDRVKLSPPHNLSVVVNSKNLELWLYWNVSAPSTCFESEVRYRKEADQWQSVLASVSATWYSLPQISQKHRYELQVRTRIADDCGQSRFWSDWSAPMFWGYTKDEPDPKPSPWNVIIQGMVFVIVVIIALVFLCLHRERIIVLPVIPKPGKNMEDLFKTCNGNVEEWLHISKEFKEGFQPNYSEPVCLVRECPAFSEVIRSVSVWSNQSECPPRVPSLSVSPPAPENVPPGLV